MGPSRSNRVDGSQVGFPDWIHLTESCVLLSLAACSCLLLCVGAAGCAANWINLLIQLSRKTGKNGFVGQACVAAGGCGWPGDRTGLYLWSVVKSLNVCNH